MNQRETIFLDRVLERAEYFSKKKNVMLRLNILLKIWNNRLTEWLIY